ncbi:hypothetical protein SCOR_05880 [Sulfidibacter corallicola]|uniref:Uncharacterized protein n=1 Tax=Sulfidibacter corallicola TaxID=2818388 RepID=A0A8A4TP01_SULCO|nr:hypothetical protein [Sulfidibacter corallicola]QTD51699.1 hypothetical protein J3U87_04445 [Sulfidibacter corallicola]
MSKLTLGIVLGGILGLLDGLSTFFVPEAADMMVQIIVGSTLKGLVTGVIIGYFAVKRKALWTGIFLGLGVGLFLSYLAALMPDPSGQHHYFEIMLPGGILGAVVGFATQKFGRQSAGTANA